MSIVRGGWQALPFESCELGEGARFVANRFIAVDLLAGRLLETTGEPGGAVSVIREVDAPLGAVAPHGDGWIAAAGDGIALLEDGEPRWLARPAAGALPMRMNDGVADPFGRFWAGAMPYSGEEGAGFLVRVDRDGTVETVLRGLTVPNGPAFSADGTTMYLADTPTGEIRAYDVDARSGALGPARRFARVEEGGPDGMTVDADGFLWSAVWGGGCLLRFAPDGSLDERIEVPARQPTSIALSTTEPYRVLVTSAAHGLADPAPEDGRILVAPVGAAGRAADVWRPRPSPALDPR